MKGGQQRARQVKGGAAGRGGERDIEADRCQARREGGEGGTDGERDRQRDGGRKGGKDGRAGRQTGDLKRRQGRAHELRPRVGPLRAIGHCSLLIKWGQCWCFNSSVHGCVKTWPMCLTAVQCVIRWHENHVF